MSVRAHRWRGCGGCDPSLVLETALPPGSHRCPSNWPASSVWLITDASQPDLSACLMAARAAVDIGRMDVFECHAWFTAAAVPLFGASAYLQRLMGGRRVRGLDRRQSALLLGILGFATLVTTVLNSVYGCDVTFNPHRWWWG